MRPSGTVTQVEGRMGTTSKVTYFEGLVESAPDAMVVVDSGGRIVLVNRQTEVLFGYDRAELVGQPVDTLVPQRARGVHPANRERYFADPKTRPMGADLNLTARRKDGTEFPVDISLSPLTTEDGTVVSAAIRDVTERNRAAEALQEAYEKLSATVLELERHDREVTVINEMGDMLQSCLSAGEAHEVIAQFAPRLFPGGSGALYTPGLSASVLEAVATWGPASPTTLVLSSEQCWALRRGRVYVVEDAAGGPRCEHLSSPPLGGSVCVPMMAQGEALGLLCYLLGPDASPAAIEPERTLALTVAEHLSLALANLSLRETLRSQSVRDPLTGLFNRRYLQVTLERELLRALRAHHPVGMIAIDIDHFKEYNDAHGHSSGDALLCALAETLQAHVRADDMVCRTGGEEFVVVLPETAREATVERAEAICAAVAALDCADEGRSSLPAPVTLSLGVATYPDDGPTAEAVLRAADEALYRAKRLGRNRVVVASTPNVVGGS